MQSDKDPQLNTALHGSLFTHSDKCIAADCHERFMDCSVAGGKEDCSCPWKHRMTDVYGESCTLRQYYYTVSFKLNMSLESGNCSVYAPRVKAAMRTALGYQVHAVLVADCTDQIKARLILNDPLPKPLQKKLQTCEYPIGDVCMLYPRLPVLKGSATEIEEENLCESLLKHQESAYEGTNECVKAGDSFWFKCKQGYREVKTKTLGRLRRSVCEDPCLTIGAEVCGDVPCVPNSDNSGFNCKCGPDFFFSATEKRCYNMKSCKVHKCERGLCVDQNGTFPASCQCNDYPDLTLTCKAIACLNTTLTCKDLCLLKDSHKDLRCCQNWDPDHCDQVKEEDLCEAYFSENLKSLGGLYVCVKEDDGHYGLRCSDKYRAVASFTRGMLDVDICTEKQCELYCTGPERQCVEGKCVCHANYFENAEGICVPQCSRKPCKNGGTCETGVKTSFYCSCPPYFTGPTCEIQFQAYAETQKKLTAVGVVLGVLIMICVGAAAVVIRRIKNRNSPNEDM
ncbi:hypothetical protein HPB49_012760 [Dermacentor silvarum]|uniref:Uncharacterized protein n=1 Tax=Dermacentor silvarum TaxID=543639 RepID=A0ACB8CL36_DERSI|nr:hypothetical protein HPB49_012760 [Dermacentor silvarum]